MIWVKTVLVKYVVLCYEEKKLCPPDKVLSGYYIRLLVEDKPGVLGAIATAFGESNVSLYSVIQKRRVGDFLK